CKVYSITGRLISISEPNNRTYELQRSNFQSGIYIIETLIKGKRHTKKIVF
ncbi:MAG: T9SS type A sorting domain-containing protein, partial [Draconibacterium sp.]|nr:T9SS type A sorting domain-containing protein [Draconibacterium sp.]